MRPTDGNITSLTQRQSWRRGKGINALLTLSKMAATLGKQDDSIQWLKLLNSTVPWFRKSWGQYGNCMGRCFDVIVEYSDALAPEPYFDDEWAQLQADSYLLDDKIGEHTPFSVQKDTSDTATVSKNDFHTIV